MQKLAGVSAFAFLIYVLFALCLPPASSQFSAQTPIQESPHPWLVSAQESDIDRLFSRPPGSPGYAVAIIKDGVFAFAKGYGLADLDDGIPISTDTSFHLASLSKQFTAAAIALLILDHKIALADPVSKYTPGAAKYGNGLRIEHLIYMTSGLH
jgi:CubicO group peptidase (beta-lactamase class C family)